MLDRRHFLLTTGAALCLTSGALAARPTMLVYKDPNCGCCDAWVTHVRRAGIVSDVREEPNMAAVKSRLGVPREVASCHTALLNGLVIEGHVPAEAILRALLERPAIAGLGVPGMPIGAPGMEVEGTPPDPFQVIAFTSNGRHSIFMDYPNGYRP